MSLDFFTPPTATFNEDPERLLLKFVYSANTLRQRGVSKYYRRRYAGIVENVNQVPGMLYGDGVDDGLTRVSMSLPEQQHLGRHHVMPIPVRQFNTGLGVLAGGRLDFTTEYTLLGRR